MGVQREKWKAINKRPYRFWQQRVSPQKVESAKEPEWYCIKAQTSGKLNVWWSPKELFFYFLIWTRDSHATNGFCCSPLSLSDLFWTTWGIAIWPKSHGSQRGQGFSPVWSLLLSGNGCVWLLSGSLCPWYGGNNTRQHYRSICKDWNKTMD